MKEGKKGVTIEIDAKLATGFNETIIDVNEDPLKKNVTKTSILRNAIIAFIRKNKIKK